MNNTFYFLRHGETKRDKSIPISKWVLSDKGIQQVERLVNEDTFKEADLIFSSTEEKAFQTAQPIADSLGKEITQLAEISELNRDQGGFMEPEEYEKAVRYCLEQIDKSVHNWETATHALNRFTRKVEKLDRQYENKKILVVGHAFTINLYFAKLLGVLNKVYERFKMNNYGDLGIIKNHEVIKDIVR